MSLSAVLIAAALRLRSTSISLLAAYLAFVAQLAALTWALSPLRFVTRAGLMLGSLALLAAATAVWARRGRPRFPLPSRRALRELVADPAIGLLLVAVVASSLYELVLVLGAPPNNWDSLTYHLTRTAAWAQHHGVYWVPNAPTDRINEFQPFAEQQVLALFAVSGRTWLFALPQWLAGLATVVGIYAAGARLGFGRRSVAFAALLFGTFPIVALESTTAQNDLVAAALSVAAIALVLGGTRTETALAGVAIGLALDAKLTTVCAILIALALALLRGRRQLATVASWALGSFVVLGMWSYVLNLAHTGHVLGHGGGRVEQQASPSLTGSTATAVRVGHDLLDLSGLSLRLTDVLAVCGLLAAVLLARRGPVALAVAALLLAPRLIPIAAHGMKVGAEAVHLPVADPANTGGAFFWGVDFGSSEDLSSFGVIGGPALLAISLVYLVRRRTAPALRIVALAFPLFVVVLALTSKYNLWLSRFLLVPVAVGAPLLAVLARRRAVALTVAAVAVLQLALVHFHNEQKPFRDHPWSESQAQAMRRTFRPGFARALPLLAGRTLTAAIGSDDPSFLLFGDRLQHRVRFLPRGTEADVVDAPGHGTWVVATRR
jgi:hypothetical protein